MTEMGGVSPVLPVTPLEEGSDPGTVPRVFPDVLWEVLVAVTEQIVVVCTRKKGGGDGGEVIFGHSFRRSPPLSPETQL